MKNYLTDNSHNSNNGKLSNNEGMTSFTRINKNNLGSGSMENNFIKEGNNNSSKIMNNYIGDGNDTSMRLPTADSTIPRNRENGYSLTDNP